MAEGVVPQWCLVDKASNHIPLPHSPASVYLGREDCEITLQVSVFLCYVFLVAIVVTLLMASTILVTVVMLVPVATVTLMHHNFDGGNWYTR